MHGLCQVTWSDSEIYRTQLALCRGNGHGIPSTIPKDRLEPPEPTHGAEIPISPLTVANQARMRRGQLDPLIATMSWLDAGKNHKSPEPLSIQLIRYLMLFSLVEECEMGVGDH